MTDSIEISTQASIEADNFREMLEDGNVIIVGLDFGREPAAVFDHGDECRVQAILDFADMIRRRRARTARLD